MGEVDCWVVAGVVIDCIDTPFARLLIILTSIADSRYLEVKSILLAMSDDI